MCCARPSSAFSELIKDTGFINLDFADVTTIMKDARPPPLGRGPFAGRTGGGRRAPGYFEPADGVVIDGAGCAVQHPPGLWTSAWRRSRRPQTSSLKRLTRTQNIIFGAMFDETMEDEIRVTVIATRF
jgi:cell division protein FtsZ